MCDREEEEACPLASSAATPSSLLTVGACDTACQVVGTEVASVVN